MGRIGQIGGTRGWRCSTYPSHPSYLSYSSYSSYFPMTILRGVLVLLFGVAAALRLAVANGYLQVSIEARLATIAGGALLGLALGWRERLRKPAADDPIIIGAAAPGHAPRRRDGRRLPRAQGPPGVPRR